MALKSTRRVYVGIAALLPFLSTSIIAQQTTREQAAIIEVLTKTTQAMNANDPLPVGELFTSQADYLDHEHSIQGIDTLKEYLSKDGKRSGRNLDVRVERVRLISKCVAIVDGSWVITGPHASATRGSSTLRGRGTAALVKAHRKWRIAAIRAQTDQQPTTVPVAAKESFWSNFPSPMWSLLLGTILSLYVSAVYSRYQRYGELVRELARARIHNEGYPTGPNDLQRAFPKAAEFWHLTERTAWELNADGQQKAAKQVASLRQFAYQAGVEIERMLSHKNSGHIVDNELSVFTARYNNALPEFQAFERNLRPQYWALFQPWPHSSSPSRGVPTVVRDPWF